MFLFVQEMYRSEGISWSNITYTDNGGCISLISKRPTGLFQLLDEESNFPQATHQTLLEKFKRHNERNQYIEFPAVMEPAFIIQHYAGKVKYGVKDFREKNTDHMRPDIVALLRSSRNAFIRGMISISPVAAFRWALLRAFFRAVEAFKQSGKNSGSKKTDIPRRTPRTPLSDLQGANTIQERSPRDINWTTRRQNRLSSSSYLEGGGIFISSSSSNENNNSDCKLLERAHGILMRSKSTKNKPSLPKHLLDVRSLKHLSNLTLHDRITKSLLHLHKKKKPPSISAQFQASLNKLMETLGQAEPYFVKCIRSNSEKVPMRFNDSLVLRQLRYTGMLETVRIRQSGYSCKYPFQDFITQFSVLLPKNVTPVRQSIQEFFWRIGHSPDQYQVGRTMVFLKEQERQSLMESLHQKVLQCIILLQRWIRARLQQKRFLLYREAAIIIQRYWRHFKKLRLDAVPYENGINSFEAACIIQSWWRCHRARLSFLKMRNAAFIIQSYWKLYLVKRQRAAVCIQAWWRAYHQKSVYQKQKKCIIALQAVSKGYLVRSRFQALKDKNSNCFVQEGDQSTVSIRTPVSNPDLDCGHLEIPEPQNVGSSGEADLIATENEVHIRERPKSLENPNQRKDVRAKRESRRMRELEQAQFSLELLKVRCGGVSPSEEQRWSAEILDKLTDTPESEGSLCSLELINTEENAQVFKDSLPEQLSPERTISSPNHKLASPAREASKDSTMISVSQTRDLATITTKGTSKAEASKLQCTPSNDDVGHLKKEDVCSPNITEVIPNSSRYSGPTISGPHSKDLPGPYYEEVNSNNRDSSQISSEISELVSSNGPVISSSTVEEKEKNPPQHMEGITSQNTPFPASTAVDMSNSASWRKKSSESPPVNNSIPISCRTHTREPVLSSSIPTFYLPQQDNVKAQEGSEPGDIPADSVLHRLQKLNDEKEELQKQLQQQKERQMMEQIRKEKQELERQRRMQEQREPQDISLGSSKRQSDRPQSLLLQNPHIKSPAIKSSVEIKGLSIGGTRSTVSNNDRPVHIAPDLKNEQKTLHEGSAGDTKDTGKRTWLHSTGNSSIFFTPKESISSDSDSSHIQRHVRGGPIKRLDATEPSGGTEAPHRRKARMARTRSDLMTRGAFGGVDSEEESDEHGELNPPTKSAEETGRLNQACHSDSEMVLQRLQGVDRSSKLQKAVSHGEMFRFLMTHSNTEPDTRSQRGKIRFWGKTKAAEKLTPQSEILEMDTQPTGREGSSATHYSDVDSGLWLVPHSPDLSRGREKENKDPSPKVQRRRSLKISSAGLEPVQWQQEHAQIICSASDLKCMDEFLQKKIGDLDSEDGKKDSLVDVLFKGALKEFRQNIFGLYSTSLLGEDGKSIRYRDLGALFEQILDKTMKLQHPRSWSESPVKVWINTFKVFLDEFVTEYKPMNYTPGKIQKTERKKRRKKDSDIVEEHNGHIFKITQYNIPTYCEYCSSLIWIMDRAAVCKLCRYACHKKCCSLINVACAKKNDSELSSRQFGVELSRLTNEDRLVPVLLEKLINYIEMHGLYTEGIYRKPGSTNKIRELRQSLDTDIDNVNLDEYNIHVIASVFKQWLRELPNPLMTFELYEEFLRSMGLGERKETVRGVYSVIDQLSRTHLSTLERLIFHLVRIAQQEETNRMSANALAIVFAPCILRCPDTTDPLQSVQDIGKTTACVELIVVEQMNKYRARLKDINSLEFAENKAKSRLSLIRRSMKPVLIAVRFMSINRSSLSGKGRLRPGLSPVISGRTPAATDAVGDHSLSSIPSEDESMEQKEAAMQQEERVLAQQIETLQKEKEELAYEMLALEPRASDDETLESEASLGTADSSENLNCESEGAMSIRTERNLMLVSSRGPRSEITRTRRQTKRDTQSTDSRDRNLSSPTASSCLPHLGRKRFHLHPFYRAQGESRELAPVSAQDSGAQLHFTSRGTFNPEKGRQKLKNVKQSPQKHRDTPDTGEQKLMGPDGSSQSLVLYGNNEFMV
ncbi:hypothetical protein GDO86_006141 [Hymenochirus boettgeri]|uniref:Myosin IXA n=2 Tax=Hymenochirus boettgeri TaxID=247094 RepID=A0A8T2J9J7_9PIPI|nr:hypothetical protein GDO86_006141 [Hymenochirus boettgeri]